MTGNNGKSADTKKILVVDDEVTLVNYLSKKLARRGFSVIKAENGIMAWGLFQQESPDLVITDIDMPELNGLELLKMVVQASPETPVIMLSGVGTIDDVTLAMRLGAWDYVPKPLESTDLLYTTIGKALEWVTLKKISRDYQESLEAMVLKKTEDLRVELQARETAEKRIIRAKREWEQTFDAIPDLIVLVDGQGRVIRVNKAMGAAIGMRLQDIPGTHFSSHFLARPSPDGASAPPQPAEYQTYEIVNEHYGGHFEVTVIPSLDVDTGASTGSIYIARNINERKKAEEEKEQMHLQLLQAQKLESVGQLAAGIAHEINTPIQYLSTNIDFLDEAFVSLGEAIVRFQEGRDSGQTGSAADAERTREILDEADWDYLKDEIPSSIEQSRNGLKRVSSIVRAMKEFSHPGSKEKEAVDLAHIIETTVLVARNEWKYVAEVVTDFDKSLPPVVCLAEEIGQVFLNLLINAAHAIGDKLGENPEGEKGTITISTRADKGWAEIRVGDTGTGIPEAIRNRIFDPFFTTKNVGRGTGQGLAIVHNVITAHHNGAIAIESTMGQGTTFILRLPLAAAR